MFTKILYLVFIVLFLIAIYSCENYVMSVDPPIDRIKDAKLDDENQVDFVINGVKRYFAYTHGHLMLLADLLSDELFFDTNIQGAIWQVYADIDIGDLRLDLDLEFKEAGQLRFLADDLLRRIEEIKFTSAKKKNEAIFVGNLYGGIARYYNAAYFGLSENQGGGVIDNGPFIPSNEMYDLAVEKLETALQYTDDAYQVRIVNSLIARMYLFKTDHTDARDFAEKGLMEGDEPFQALYSVQGSNRYWGSAGRGHTQSVVDWRFRDYVASDSAETARIPLDPIMGLNDVLYDRQGKYLTEASPIIFISWQENELMLAELDLLNGNNNGAVTRINNVRSSHGIAPLVSVDMKVLIAERDKELFVTGMRLIDQRRFDNEYDTWHLAANAWRYFPIPDSERLVNPNIP